MVEVESVGGLRLRSSVGDWVEVEIGLRLRTQVGGWVEVESVDGLRLRLRLSVG